jgi:hypothetical protein
LNTILKIEDITLKCLTVSSNSGMQYIKLQNVDILFLLHFFSGKVEVMMQVNTIPVIVISGSGKSVSDAQESAARVILSYFKSKLNIQ